MDKELESLKIIINPKTIKKSKQWIVNEYPKLAFEGEKERHSSTNEEQCKINNECNEELCEFLRPVLESKEAKQNKVFGKSMKSHAQALGIKQCSDNKKLIGNKLKEKKTKTNVNKQNEDDALKDVVVSLQSQVKQLKDLIMKMSNVVVMDNKVKNAIITQVNQIEEI